MKHAFFQFFTLLMVLLAGLTTSWVAGTPQVTSGITIQGGDDCGCNGLGPKRCDEIFKTQSCRGQSDDVKQCSKGDVNTSTCTSDSKFDCGTHCGVADIQKCS